MKLFKKFSIGLAVATLSIAANAGFITVEGAGDFTSAQNEGGNSMVIDNLSAAVSRVKWGEDQGDGQSSLRLTDQAQQDIDFLDTNYLLSTLTHFNNNIGGHSSTWLDKAIINGLLNITGADGGPISIPNKFDIDFKETRNEGGTNTAYCNIDPAKDNGETGPTDPNQHNHGTLCDDRFDYTVDGGSFPVIIPLMIAGDEYYLTVFAATDAAGNNAITANRFWTQENADTSVYTFARLARVPEPASIAILGLGLLGLATSRKRKAK